ncbi:MAG: CDP-alcohol phosphatidyltransferase family protein [Granulosicoccus sp.]
MRKDESARSDEHIPDRRPLASRNTQWAQRFARYLASTSITPNQISYGSMVFAGIACTALVISTRFESGLYVLCMALAVVACQFRLICNLMDGMVAIEAGKQTPDGALWNEFPDRIADIAILVGLGVAAGVPLLGWVAATAAVLVAYIRELGKGIDGVVDFTGPMAKPHRMALVSAGAVFSALGELLVRTPESDSIPARILMAVLAVLIVGCVLTVWRRVRAILNRLDFPTT